MMDRLSNPAKIRAFDLAEEMKRTLRPLFEKHQDDIISGHFSSTMMTDWAAGDANLLKWRAETNGTPFELQDITDAPIDEQIYYDQGDVDDRHGQGGRRAGLRDHGVGRHH